jgi:hypothetical protein
MKNCFSWKEGFEEILNNIIIGGVGINNSNNIDN